MGLCKAPSHSIQSKAVPMSMPLASILFGCTKTILCCSSKDLKTAKGKNKKKKQTVKKTHNNSISKIKKANPLRKAAFERQSFASLLCLNRCILVIIPSIPYVNCRTEQRWKTFIHEFTTTPSAGSLLLCIIHSQGWEVQKQLGSNEKLHSSVN